MINGKRWTTKYRPSRIADCVLPPDLRNRLQCIIERKHSPHLLLIGPPGVGKTTVSLALGNELGWFVWLRNASLDGRIENVRTEILETARYHSDLYGRPVAVLLDEADYLTAEAQAALRNILDEARCPFVLTANYPDKLIEPLRSRCALIEFDFAKDRASLIAAFQFRLNEILACEQLECAEGVLDAVLAAYFPDFRKVLNELESRIA
jgi:DNA polymerase III delta prime subunit